MTPSGINDIFVSSTEAFWDNVTALVPNYVLFILGVAFVAIVIWVVMKAPRKIING